MSLPPNPSENEIDNFVLTSSPEDLKKTLSSIRPGFDGLYHPSDEYLKEQIEKKLKTQGGRRLSKKRPTARRRRSSKRNARKARATRRR